MAEVDRRSTRGKELAARLNKETTLKVMPKLYYVEDGNRVRLGRTDWSGDVFNIIAKSEFAVFKRIYEEVNMPLIDLTDDDDGSMWAEIKTA